MADRLAAGLTRRLVWAALLTAGAGLVAASAYRAATFPFTHDESLSFTLFTSYPGGRGTANNHLLNTFLMERCSALLGNSEPSLRLPNVLAHALYVVGTLLLLRRIRHPVLLGAGFVLLNVNPYLLDWFCLARGYGLALAFLVVSLYFLVRAHEDKRQSRFVKYVYLSVLTGSLAVLANFAFLNYYLPLLLACAWLLLSDAGLRRFHRGHLRDAAALLAACGAFLAFVLFKAALLRLGGHLYFGGSSGFLSDTVGSLVRCSLYTAPISEGAAQAVSVTLVASCALLLLVGLRLLFSTEPVPALVPLVLILALAAALPVAQFRLLGTLYPIERAALYYLPLLALALTFALDLGTQRARRCYQELTAVLPAGALAVVLLGHFGRTFDPHTCYTWPEEAHNVGVLELIDRDRQTEFPGRSVTLGNDWEFEPSLNYYRVTRHYTWLAPVTRDPPTTPGRDYVYARQDALGELLARRPVILASYADSRTVLLRLPR
jgi:hypothetical protein